MLPVIPYPGELDTVRLAASITGGEGGRCSGESEGVSGQPACPAAVAWTFETCYGFGDKEGENQERETCLGTPIIWMHLGALISQLVSLTYIFQVEAAQDCLLQVSDSGNCVLSKEFDAETLEKSLSGTWNHIAQGTSSTASGVDSSEDDDENEKEAAVVVSKPRGRVSHQSLKPSAWSEEEDSLLWEGVKKFGFGKWNAIRAATGLSRTSAQLNQRHVRLVKLAGESKAKKDDKEEGALVKASCPTPGCDGTGNRKRRYLSHVTVEGCPKVGPQVEKKRKREEKSQLSTSSVDNKSKKLKK
jgi:hypothetical protein